MNSYKECYTFLKSHPESYFKKILESKDGKSIKIYAGLNIKTPAANSPFSQSPSIPSVFIDSIDQEDIEERIIEQLAIELSSSSYYSIIDINNQ